MASISLCDLQGWVFNVVPYVGGLSGRLLSGWCADKLYAFSGIEEEAMGYRFCFLTSRFALICKILLVFNRNICPLIHNEI